LGFRFARAGPGGVGLFRFSVLKTGGFFSGFRF
jgi:hypothetical protein